MAPRPAGRPVAWRCLVPGCHVSGRSADPYRAITEHYHAAHADDPRRRRPPAP